MRPVRVPKENKTKHLPNQRSLVPGGGALFSKNVMKKLNREACTLALCIALFPPIWAVLAPYIGVQTGAVALICAGIYVAAGNEKKRALPMSLGFLAGDAWAVLALWIMELLPWNANVELFSTLFVLGGAAVLIASVLPRVFYLPAWLSGWAIGLTILAPAGWANLGTVPIQIGVAMLVGVWYVGVGVDTVHRLIRKGRDKHATTADEENHR